MLDIKDLPDCVTDLFDIVEEPMHSFGIMKEFEKKYNKSSSSFYKLIDKMNDAEITSQTEKDFKRWKFSIDTFLKTCGGHPDLISDFCN